MLPRRIVPLALLAFATVLFAPTAAPATACDQICFVGVACCCDGEFVGCYDSEAECPCGAQVLETEQASELEPLFSETPESTSACLPTEVSLP